MKADSRGSLWRQWDLHFHTPSSFDYGNGAATDEQLVEAIVAAGVAAVAVTDHHVMDVARIHNMQRIARDRLVVFPGIELRTELGGHESVHFVGIFPHDCDVADLWNKIQGPLDITAVSVRQKGNERVYVPFTEAARLFHDLGGVVSVHAGKKENSIERIYNAEEFKQAFKEDLAREHIDILEIGSLKDERGYREIVFPHLGFPLPLIITSDNHNHQSYTRKSLCWLKADVTFRGLLHVLHEPIGRVYLGELPPAVARVNDNRTRYVQSVSISKKADSPFTEHWFDGAVPLNHGLVAIIGNKGSGKSALADIIGLLGDSPNGHSFSFLNQDKFRQPRDNKAKHFEAEITWESCGKHKCSLDDDVDSSAIESVKYVPQAYLERVCNELGTGTESSFTRELRSVIFSHIDEADRLGHGDLDGLLKYHTEETNATIGLLHKDLQAAIQTVVSIEERLSPGHRKTLENQLEMKKRELANHDATKPTAVPKPTTDPNAAQAQSQIEGRITGLEAEITKLQDEILALTSARAKAKRRVAAADRLLERIANLEKYVLNVRNESIADCAELSLDVDNVIKVEVNKSLVTTARGHAAQEDKDATAKLNPDAQDSPAWKKRGKGKEVEQLRLKLDEPQRLYQQYLTNLATWTTKQKELIGDATTVGSLRHIESQLTALDGLPAELQAARDHCLNIAAAVYQKISALAASYRNVYQPVQRFITEHPLAQGRFDLQFEAAIMPIGFERGFLGLINQGRKGSFCGQDEGMAVVRRLVREADFGSDEGLRSFLETMEKHLTHDLRQEKPEPVALSGQLKKDATSAKLYQYLYSLDYLKPHYTLRWAGKDIEQLSPGERGTLLLIFYLLIDRSEVPLVIDQPEENLDSQTVYDILVPSFKEAKTRRQIIVVTHNPNLAVVCDADQIIYASMDKENGNRIEYACGAIENPVINKKVVDVLEGTRPAFENREGKYRSCEDLTRRPRGHC